MRRSLLPFFTVDVRFIFRIGQIRARQNCVNVLVIRLRAVISKTLSTDWLLNQYNVRVATQARYDLINEHNRDNLLLLSAIKINVPKL